MGQPKFSCDILWYTSISTGLACLIQEPICEVVMLKKNSLACISIFGCADFLSLGCPSAVSAKDPNCLKTEEKIPTVQCQLECFWFHDIHTWLAGSACTLWQVHSFQWTCHLNGHPVPNLVQDHALHKVQWQQTYSPTQAKPGKPGEWSVASFLEVP
jgi:hypothetical protein